MAENVASVVPERRKAKIFHGAAITEPSYPSSELRDVEELIFCCRMLPPGTDG